MIKYYWKRCRVSWRDTVVNPRKAVALTERKQKEGSRMETKIETEG